MRNLAATYRPVNLADVVGQEQAKAILSTHLATKPKSSYLFTGNAGTGKTTCARIFARGLNNGSDFNIIEINAADNTGVDGVRKIISDANRLPIGTPYKIFVLDECHMLSTQAWNALLKLIEEPPDTVVFLLCTTDPQKVPGTIMSRVLRVDFKRIDLNLIVQRLSWILEQEQLPPIDEKSLKYIAELANGGMRDAISLLDKVLGYGVEVTPELINTALGMLGAEKSYQLLERICQHDLPGLIKLIDELSKDNLDYKAWILDFRRFVVKAMWISLGVESDSVVMSEEIVAKIKQVATGLDLVRVAECLNQLCNDLILEADPRSRIATEFTKLAVGYD